MGAFAAQSNESASLGPPAAGIPAASEEAAAPVVPPRPEPTQPPPPLPEQQPQQPSPPDSGAAPSAPQQAGGVVEKGVFGYSGENPPAAVNGGPLPPPPQPQDAHNPHQQQQQQQQQQQHPSQLLQESPPQPPPSKYNKQRTEALYREAERRVHARTEQRRREAQTMSFMPNCEAQRDFKPEKPVFDRLYMDASKRSEVHAAKVHTAMVVPKECTFSPEVRGFARGPKYHLKQH